MARGRSSPISHDHRPSERHRRRSRGWRRSPSPEVRPINHQPERGRSPPKGPKELFPNRHPPGAEKNRHHRPARDPSPIKSSSHRRREREESSRDRGRDIRHQEHPPLAPYFDTPQTRNFPSTHSPPATHRAEYRDRSRSKHRGHRKEKDPRRQDWSKSAHRDKRHNEPSNPPRESHHNSSRKRSRSPSHPKSPAPRVAQNPESSSYPEPNRAHRDRLPGQRKEPVKLGRHTVVKEDWPNETGDKRVGQLDPRHASPVAEPSRRHRRDFSPSSDHSLHKETRQRQTSHSPRGRLARHRRYPDDELEGIHPSRRPRHGSREPFQEPLIPLRRSPSPSAHSAVSRASYWNRSRGASPDMYNNHPYSRGRQYPSRIRQYSNSPPHHYSHSGQGYHGDHRGGWSSHGSPPPGYHGQHSPSQSGYHQPPSPYYQNTSYSQSHPSANPGNNSFRGRGNATTPTRAHFQNLSWTPDKGSRGGAAPSERRLPPRRDSETTVASNSGVPADDDFIRPKPEPGEQHENERRPGKEDSTASKANTKDGSPKVTTPLQDDQASPAAKQTSIKFAMKVPLQPALAKRPNVIQSVPKPPSRPSIFQASENQDRSRRPESTSSRGKPTAPRFGSSRYDDFSAPRHPRDSRLDRDPYRHERPPHPSHRDRRPYDDRDVDVRARGRFERDHPKTLKSSRPRRKKFRKVLKTHRRVVLPARTLPKSWALSDFVYYPRPDRHSVVGAGTYGKVFKAHNVYLNKCVALKTLPLIKPRRKPGTREYVSRDKKRKRQERWVKDGLHLTSLREIKLLKSISHQDDNIVGIREIFLEGTSCNLVFDYFEFDMHGIIYSANVGLEDCMMKDLVLQVFRGLDYLHTKANILHRDIKAANILVSAHGQVRITDFGLAKHVKEKSELDALPWYRKKFEHSNRVITTPYRPPELLLGATLYGGEVDVWSAGCVLFEAFLKKLPFQGTGEDVDHLLTIWKILGLPNVNLYPEVVDLEWYWLFMTRIHPKKPIFARLYKNKISPQLYHLLRCIFQLDPKKRPTAAQVLTHPFFTSESPLPECARPVLEKVEGEWHELEYKMIRDKEKAVVRQKQEDSVILEYLKHKQTDHARRLTSAEEAEMENHASRVEFYKSEQANFQARLEAREQQGETEDDHARQVAEMKKTHGDMYMDAARRGRYRGPSREKMDEKLLQEAVRWYEEEKKKGNNPISLAPVVSKVRTQERGHQPAKPLVPKDKGKHASMLQSVLKSEVGKSAAVDVPRNEKREERKREYQRRKEEYDCQLLMYQQRLAKAQQKQIRMPSGDKRSAASPLVDERIMKRAKE